MSPHTHPLPHTPTSASASTAPPHPSTSSIINSQLLPDTMYTNPLTIPTITTTHKSDSIDDGSLSIITVADVERMLGRHRHQYTVELADNIHDDDLNVNGSDSVNHLKFRNILSTEGCAICLGRADVDSDGKSNNKKQSTTGNTLTSDHTSNNMNDDTTGIATLPSSSPSSSTRYAVLRCNLLQCQHVLHLGCLINAHIQQRTSSTSPLGPLVPTLDGFHSTNYMQIIQLNGKANGEQSKMASNSTNNGLYDFLSMNRRTSQNGTKQCLIEFGLAHHISNAQILRINIPTALTSYIDSITGSDVITHQFTNPDNTPHEYQNNHLSNEYNSTSENKVLNGGINDNIQKRTGSGDNTFHILRGKIYFRCTDMTTGMVSTHMCNYDLSEVHESTTSTPTQSILLVLIDQQTRNILTIAVTPLQIDRLNHEKVKGARDETRAAGEADDSSGHAENETKELSEEADTVAQASHKSTRGTPSSSTQVEYRIDRIKYEFAQQLSPFSHFVPPLRYDSNTAALYHSLSPVLSPSTAGAAGGDNSNSSNSMIHPYAHQYPYQSQQQYTTLNIPSQTSPHNFIMRQQSGASVDLNFQQYQHLLNPTSPNNILMNSNNKNHMTGADGQISPRRALYAAQQQQLAQQQYPSMNKDSPSVLSSDPSSPIEKLSNPQTFDNIHTRQESFPSWNTLQAVNANNLTHMDQRSTLAVMQQNASAYNNAHQNTTLNINIHPYQSSHHTNTHHSNKHQQQHDNTGGSNNSYHHHRSHHNSYNFNNQNHGRSNFHGVQSFNPALAALQHINPSNPNDPSLLHLTVDQLVGNVCRIAKTHAGSRLLQSKLEARDDTYFNVCYNEIQYCLSELAVDHYGHFCLEKLLLMCNNQQIHTLLSSISTNISSIACQKHGSFSIQTLIDCITTDNTDSILLLMESIKNNILSLITHPAGHFVILKILQKFPYEYTSLIDKCIVSSLYDIAIDHHGLRVLKMYLHSRTEEQINDLCQVAVSLTLSLVENSYGNYFVQSLLDVCTSATRSDIKSKMLGQYVRLSQSKFSSNVVEKCLIQSHTQWRSIIIHELVAPHVVKQVITDRYSNYVCQTAVTVANMEQIDIIATAVNPHLPSLRENVRKKWKTLLVQAKQQLAYRGAPPVIPGVTTADDAGEPVSPVPSAEQTNLAHSNANVSANNSVPSQPQGATVYSINNDMRQIESANDFAINQQHPAQSPYSDTNAMYYPSNQSPQAQAHMAMPISTPYTSHHPNPNAPQPVYY